MNKIYKVVWSKAKGMYVVVSELAKNSTKGCSSKKLLAMLIATGVMSAGLLVGGMKAEAQVRTTSGSGTNSIRIYEANAMPRYVYAYLNTENGAYYVYDADDDKYYYLNESGYLDKNATTDVSKLSAIGTWFTFGTIAAGEGSVAIGENAVAIADQSIAIGEGATVQSDAGSSGAPGKFTSDRSVAIGNGATVSGAKDAVALGSDSYIGVGSDSSAAIANSTIGFNSSDSVAIGNSTILSYGELNSNNNLYSDSNTSIAGSYVAGDKSVAISDSTVTGSHSFAAASSTIDPNGNNDIDGTYGAGEGNNSVAIGNSTINGGKNSVALAGGTITSTTSGGSNIAMGDSATIYGSNAIAEGAGTRVNGTTSQAVGSGNTIGAWDNVYGDTSDPTKVTDVVVNTSGTVTNSSAFGDGNTVTASEATAVGSGNTVSGYRSTALGKGNQATGAESTAIGVSSVASGDKAIASGRSARAKGNQSVASGFWARADADDTIAVGTNSQATGTGSTTIGAYSKTTAADSVALGSNSVATRSASDTADQGAISSFADKYQTKVDATYGEVNIGNSSGARVLGGVATGVTDTDAVNVRQWKSTTLQTTGNSGTNNTTLYDEGLAIVGDGQIVKTTAGSNQIKIEVDTSKLPKSIVEGGANTVVNPVTDESTGNTTYTVNSYKTTVSSADSRVTVTPNTSADGYTTNYEIDTSGLGTMNNFNIAQNGETKKAIGNGDTVNFVNGTNTTAVVGTDGTVTFNATDTKVETVNKNVTNRYISGVMTDGNTNVDLTLNIDQIKEDVDTDTDTRNTTEAGSNITVDKSVTGKDVNNEDVYNYTVSLNKNIDLTQEGSLTIGDTYIDNSKVNTTTVNAGTTNISTALNITNGATINMGDNQITHVASGAVNNEYTNLTNGANIGDVINISKANDTRIADGTYAVDNNGVVTLPYEDGNGNEISGMTAKITGIAKQDLSNITKEGNTVISNIAANSVKVAQGVNTVVNSATTTNPTTGVSTTTYTVDAYKSTVSTTDSRVKVTPSTSTDGYTTDYAISLDLSTVGSMSGFNIADEHNHTDSITDGETVTFQDGTNTTATVSADGKVKYDLNDDIELTKDGGVTIKGGDVTVGDTTKNYGDIVINQGNVTFGGNQITNVASGITNNLYDTTISGQENYNNVANIGDVYKISNDSEVYVQNKAYSVDNNGTVTLNYVDGNGNVLDKTATISGIAKSDLSNITNEGNKVINNIANKAVKVVDGNNTTVDSEVKTDANTGLDYTEYKVNVDLSNVGGMDSFDVAGNGTVVNSIGDGNVVDFVDSDNINATVTKTADGVEVSFDLDSEITVGKDGKDGYIGVDGADGVSGVGINGKDGSIGLTGADGKTITIKGLDGTNGTNGVDGSTVDRIVINNHEVATLDDGIKYAGDVGNAYVKLDQTTTVAGGATNAANLTTGNIGVVAEQDGKDAKLTVKLNKDIDLTEKGSVTIGDTVINNNGLTIDNGSTTYGDIVINQGNVNFGGNQITNVASGITNNLYDTTVTGQENYNNVANIGDVYKISNDSEVYVQNKAYTVDNNGTVTLNYVDGNGNVLDKTATISGIAKSDLSNITNEGNKVINNIAMNSVRVVDGNNTTVDSEVKTDSTTGLDYTEYKVNVDLSGYGTMSSFNVAENGTQVDSIGDGNTVNFVDGSNTVANVTTDGNGNVSVTYDLSDNIEIGKAGADGQDGKDGYIGVNGKDGVSGVGINGADGTIGLTGPKGEDGKNASATVGVNFGPGSLVDSMNQDDGTMTRLYYTDDKGTHQVATMDDGLKFKGENQTTAYDTTLNNTVTFQGAATVDGDNNTKNVTIEATQDEEDGDVVYNVKLNKDINLGADGSVTIGNTYIDNDGLTIGSGNTSIIINQGNVSYGGNQITNMGSGSDGTDDNGKPTYNTDTNGANIGDVKNIAGDIVNNVVDGKTFGLTAEDGNSVTKNLDNTVSVVGDGTNISTKVENGKVVVELSKDVDLGDDGSLTVGDTTIDASGIDTNKITVGDVSIDSDGIHAGDKTITDVKSAIGNKDLSTITDETTLNSAVNVGDLKNVKNDLQEDINSKMSSFNVSANDGTKTEIGDGNVVNFNDSENITAVVTPKEDDSGVDVSFDLNNDITIGGKDGKDGSIGVAGADGKDGVSIYTEGLPGKDGTNGTNGHIGLTGNQGANGMDGKDGLSADIMVKNGQNGVDGTDGANGTDGMTRIVYEDQNGTEHEVATLDDGIKYQGDVGNAYVKLDQTTTITGGATNYSSNNNIAVVASQDGDNAKLELRLADDISVNSVTANEFKTKNVTINNDGIDAGDTNITNVKSGIVNGDDSDNSNAANIGDVKQIAGQAVQNVDNKVNKLSNRLNKGLAGAAALAALHPLDFDPDDKLTFAAGVGNYRGENAGAVGMFYRPDEKVMFSLGATVGNDNNMVNAGVSFSLDRTARVTNSKTAMAREILDMRAEMAELKAMVNNMGAWMGVIDEYRNVLFPDVPENHWAYEYVEMLANRGIIEGYPNGRFDGDRSMTRYEFAALLARALQKGAVLSDAIEKEFGPELSRIRVDRISGEDGDKRKVERIRVNGDKYDEAGNQIERRDHYGSVMPIQQVSAK